MKKFLTIAFCTLALGSAMAKDVAVVTNGALQPGVVHYGWWNNKNIWEASNPNGEAKVWTVSANDGGSAYSGGIFTDGIVTDALHSTTLNFNWYSPSVGAKYHIRLTSDQDKTEQDYEFEVTAENANKWNETSLNVTQAFPTVADKWSKVKDGKGYIFSIVSDGTNPAGNTISFQNIYYSNVDEAWTEPIPTPVSAPTSVPSPTKNPASALSLFSYAYSPATTYQFGGWGQKTQTEEIEVDGKKVLKLNSFDYLGLELTNHIDISSCDKVHVDVFPVTGKTMGFTPISPGHELTYKREDLKPGEWNSIEADLSYFTGVDMKDIFQFKFNEGNNGIYYIGNLYFYNSKDDNTPTETPTDTPATPTANVQSNQEVKADLPIVLITATTGADIFYKINHGEFTKYINPFSLDIDGNVDLTFYSKKGDKSSAETTLNNISVLKYRPTLTFAETSISASMLYTIPTVNLTVSGDISSLKDHTPKVRYELKDTNNAIYNGGTIDANGQITLNQNAKDGDKISVCAYIVEDKWYAPASDASGVATYLLTLNSNETRPTDPGQPTSVPAPTQSAASVISLFSEAYTAVTTFRIGGWGQSTKTEEVVVDSKKALKLTDFNYLGWELNEQIDISSCDKVHVDVFPVTGNYMRFTPISPGRELPYECKNLKAGEWNSIDADLSYFSNVNMKNIFQFKFDEGNQGTYYIGNVYFYNSRGDIGSTIVDAPEAPTANVAGEQEIKTDFKIELTTTTEGAEIFYRINQGDFVKYVNPFSVDMDGSINLSFYSQKGDKSSPVVTIKNIRVVKYNITLTSVPTPTHEEISVVSLYSHAYPAVTTFTIGNWGQSTQTEEIEVDGKKVMKLSNFNYLGWNLAKYIDLTYCDKIHVDVYPVASTYMTFTPLSNEKGRPYECSNLKAGEWNSIDADLSYFTGIDLTDISQFKFDNGNNEPYFIGNVYFYNSRGENANPPAPEAPVANVASGQEIKADFPIALTTTTEGADIYYKVNQGNFIKYVNPFSLNLNGNADLTFYSKKANKSSGEVTVNNINVLKYRPLLSLAENEITASMAHEIPTVNLTISGETSSIEGHTPKIRYELKYANNVIYNGATIDANGKITLNAIAKDGDQFYVRACLVEDDWYTAASADGGVAKYLLTLSADNYVTFDFTKSGAYGLEPKTSEDTANANHMTITLGDIALELDGKFIQYTDATNTELRFYAPDANMSNLLKITKKSDASYVDGKIVNVKVEGTNVSFANCRTLDGDVVNDAELLINPSTGCNVKKITVTLATPKSLYNLPDEIVIPWHEIKEHKYEDKRDALGATKFFPAEFNENVNMTFAPQFAINNYDVNMGEGCKGHEADQPNYSDCHWFDCSLYDGLDDASLSLGVPCSGLYKMTLSLAEGTECPVRYISTPKEIVVKVIPSFNGGDNDGAYLTFNWYSSIDSNNILWVDAREWASLTHTLVQYRGEGTMTLWYKQSGEPVKYIGNAMKDRRRVTSKPGEVVTGAEGTPVAGYTRYGADGLDFTKGKTVSLVFEKNGVYTDPITFTAVHSDSEVLTGVEQTPMVEAEAEYFTIDGLRIANADYLQPGMYIKRQGEKSTIVIIQ